MVSVGWFQVMLEVQNYREGLNYFYRDKCMMLGFGANVVTGFETFRVFTTNHPWNVRCVSVIICAKL
jgi:hypothetical protein